MNRSEIIEQIRRNGAAKVADRVEVSRSTCPKHGRVFELDVACCEDSQCSRERGVTTFFQCSGGVNSICVECVREIITNLPSLDQVL